jgi:hypothetical protein
MLIHVAAAVLHPLFVLIGCVPGGGVTCAPNQADDHLSKPVLDSIAGPMLTSAQFLIPAAVALSGLHKMMEHRESGGSFLIDMVTKGGGAVLVLALIKSIAGVG